jgi:hypothetical protein
LGGEVLLFLQKLHDLLIQTPEGTRSWHLTRRGQTATVSSNTDATSSQRWRLFRTSDAIPKKHLRPDQ